MYLLNEHHLLMRYDLQRVRLLHFLIQVNKYPSAHYQASNQRHLIQRIQVLHFAQ